MKRLFSIVLIVFAANLAAQAPKITFKDSIIDFGTVVQGSEQIRTFTITNTGTAPLVITNIRGACGCTTFPENWPKDPIPPGGSASFKVKYDTSIRVGAFDKQIMIYSNAVNNINGMYTVKIKGKVVPAGSSGSGQ